ncbi:MAG TPA: primosomal protein N' [Verrucomicrobiae bacterium]|nr:primosomal protein N' [Verrucomicrobiae bacterium]
MHFYEVLVATQTYHGDTALTYSSEVKLEVGALVRVSLRARTVLGIVLRTVPKPNFDIKPIIAILPSSPVPTAQLKLMHWIRTYYPAPLGAVARLFVPPGEVPARISKANTENSLPKSTTEAHLPSLSPGQSRAIETIVGPGTFLLHGVTGSGKTRVYTELALRAFQQGKSALILTPEIGLTAQLTVTVSQTFGDNVYVLHSRLTAAQRRTIYYELLERSKPCVIIGPRSALFSPIHSLGLIVLDEAHDGAYKNESAPHYQASRVAAKLADMHNATLVLGSATPAVEDYYIAQAKGRPIVTIRNIAPTSEASVVFKTIDMRERKLFSRNSLLSNTLLDSINSALQHEEQSLLYLNRRGTANVILCSSCGWQSLCKNCDLALTYHGDTHELRCHVCGFLSPLPTSCPVCNCAQILFKSAGTKTVVDALTKVFPTAKIQRFDTDALKAERLEQHLSDLVAGSADIIVGTQIIGKGLDLPKLSVVGIVNADSSLLIPDFTASERTYQLLTQVIGRVGRGHRSGTVVVQTYDPANFIVQAAINRRWRSFYEAELCERRAFHFPPFVHLLKLRVLRATSKSAEEAANNLARSLTKNNPRVNVEGPAPSFHPRERGKYSWQLLVKSPSRPTLVDIIHSLPSGWSYDIDPSNLL